MSPIINPNDDGIAHVNIYSQSKTNLGKMLSNFYKFRIKTDDGIFNSVEAYWYWLSIEDCPEKEVLRNLHWYTAKQKGKELEEKYARRHDDNFEKKILRAIWYKVRRHPQLFTSRVSRLPFEHYYNFGSKIVDVKEKHLWMVEGIDKMRKHMIKEVSQ